MVRRYHREAQFVICSWWKWKSWIRDGASGCSLVNCAQGAGSGLKAGDNIIVQYLKESYARKWIVIIMLVYLEIVPEAQSRHKCAIEARRKPCNYPRISSNPITKQSLKELTSIQVPRSPRASVPGRAATTTTAARATIAGPASPRKAKRLGTSLMCMIEVGEVWIPTTTTPNNWHSPAILPGPIGPRLLRLLLFSSGVCDQACHAHGASVESHGLSIGIDVCGSLEHGEGELAVEGPVCFGGLFLGCNWVGS